METIRYGFLTMCKYPDLKQDIYPKLSHYIIFSDLAPSDHGEYYVMTCPHCKSSKKFYGYKSTYKASCNRKNNCPSNGKPLSWWDYVAEKYNLSNKRDVYRKLAELAGITIGDHVNKGTNTTNYKDITKSYFDICKYLLFKNEEACKYLTEERKIKEADLKLLDVGCRAKLPYMLKSLKNEGFGEMAIADFFLKHNIIKQSGNGKEYQPIEINKVKYNTLFANHCLVIATRDLSGNIVGFTCRGIKDGLEPKYVNSTSDITSYPFNLNNAVKHAYQSKTKTLIIVEGFFDALTLRLNGFQNVCALGRCTITDSQLKTIMSTGVKNLKLALDPDDAGILGLKESSIKIMKVTGLRPYIVLMKNGLDPDKFIREIGPKALETSISFAPSACTWIGNILVEKSELNDTERDMSRKEAVGIYAQIQDSELKNDFSEVVKKIIKKAILAKQANLLRDKILNEKYRNSISGLLKTCHEYLKENDIESLGNYITYLSKRKEPSRKTPEMHKYFLLVKKIEDLYKKKFLFRIVELIHQHSEYVL